MSGNKKSTKTEKVHTKEKCQEGHLRQPVKIRKLPTYERTTNKYVWIFDGPSCSTGNVAAKSRKYKRIINHRRKFFDGNDVDTSSSDSEINTPIAKAKKTNKKRTRSDNKIKTTANKSVQTDNQKETITKKHDKSKKEKDSPKKTLELPKENIPNKKNEMLQHDIKNKEQLKKLVGSAKRKSSKPRKLILLPY